MMKQVLGLVFSNMHDHMVSELTAHRCMGSIPVGGRYRLIDFVLSGFANSGVENVGVVTKSNYQSLMNHLGNGREWDLSRKRGGLIILPPFGRAGAGGIYRTRIEALAGVMGFIHNSAAEYVLGSDCDIMANIDYAPFVRQHKETGADITLMYKKIEVAPGEERKDFCTLTVDDQGNLTDMLINPAVTGEQNIYLNVILISKNLLETVVGECYSRNLFSFDEHVLQAGIGKYKICTYEFTGHVSRFDSMKSYYHANLEMLDPKVRDALFPQERPIYTKVRDEAPVRYGLNAKTKNSLLADGCLIEGEVENSLIFRGVTIAKGAKVKNCIVMQGTYVGANSNLEYVITDKDVDIKESRMIMGFATYPVYISKGSSV